MCPPRLGLPGSLTLRSWGAEFLERSGQREPFAPKSALFFGLDESLMRNALGNTQVEVAEAAGVPEAEISRVESGEALLLSSLMRYAQALGGEIEVAIVIAGRRYLIDGGGFAGPV